MKKGKFRIGTSNVVVPGNKTTFPPAYQSKSRLHFYATFFNSLEVNSCFYKTPMLSTYEKWANDVPTDFQFSLKLSKDITHVKELKCDLAGVEKFINAANGTGTKKGCVLVQFPGKITFDYFTQVENILEQIKIVDTDNEWRIAVEFRHNSWYTGEMNELLQEFDAALVLHDIPKGKNIDRTGRADFIYMRFHGPTGNYRDSYSDAFLKERSAQIKEWMKDGKDVYAYFNNTIGNAYENALTLKKYIGGQ